MKLLQRLFHELAKIQKQTSSILNLNTIYLYAIYKYFVQPIFINCG